MVILKALISLAIAGAGVAVLMHVTMLARALLVGACHKIATILATYLEASLSSPEFAMELKVLTLNLHTYQEHHGDLWHVLQEHGREVYLIAEAIVHENVDVICLQEVGEHFHDHITRPYGFSESNMAFRIQKKIREMSGRHFHLFQDWSHIGFGCWREGTAILSRYPMHDCVSPWVTWNKDTGQMLIPLNPLPQYVGDAAGGR